MILGSDFVLVLSLGVARLNSLSYLGPGGKLVLKGTTFKSSSLLFRSGNLQRTWTPRSMQHFTYLPPVPTYSLPPFVIRQCRRANGSSVGAFFYYIRQPLCALLPMKRARVIKHRGRNYADRYLCL